MRTEYRTLTVDYQVETDKGRVSSVEIENISTSEGESVYDLLSDESIDKIVEFVFEVAKDER